MIDFTALGLTAEQIDARRHYIGASDLPTIMGGDPERLMDLWNFKRGGAPVDLSDNLAVLMGQYTESLNAYWLEKQTGIVTVRNQESLGDGLIRATLDGATIIEDRRTVIEFKHVGGREPPETILDRYTPQLTGQMIASGARHAILSVIEGNGGWFYVETEYDEAYAQAVQSAAEAFWASVQSGEPPVVAEPVKPPRPPGWREIDMTPSNAWSVNAPLWLDLAPKTALFKTVVEDLKAAIPEDAKMATGHGLKASISKTGAVRFSALGEKQED